MPSEVNLPETQRSSAKAREIHRRLQRRYRAADLGNLPDPLDEAIYIILSKQTQEAVYQELFEALALRCGGRWGTILTMDQTELQALLKPGGFQRQRAGQLRALMAALRERCDQLGIDELTLDWLSELDNEACERELMALPGIGAKTARCVMSYSLGRNVLAVDTHVARVMTRVGLIDPPVGKPKHADIEPLIPARIRVRFHVNLIHHGRAVCTARHPKCDACEIAYVCASASDMSGE